MKHMLRERLKHIALGVLAMLAPIVASPALAQVYLYDPGFPSGPIEASDPIVGLALPGATPAEYRAHLRLLWKWLAPMQAWLDRHEDGPQDPRLIDAASSRDQLWRYAQSCNPA